MRLHQLRRSPVRCAGLLMLLLQAALPTPAHAQAGWQAVDAATLDEARGGFVAPSGLTVALGIDRLVSVNGEVLAQSHIAIADMSRISHSEAEQTGAALSSIKLVQHGNDNIYLAPLAQQAMAGIVIQNSLDGQLIRSETIINSTVNSMGLLKAINVQASLGDALLRAAGNH
jgi:hypothetical protein